MKLNLWNIANQLSKYDTEVKISSSIERIISGPLPVSTIGSLYVRSRGSDVICYSEQGTIIIHDMNEGEGFLLIQSIFNWYDSWMEDIEKSLLENDFRRFVHLCAKAFSNPVLFMDSNNSLLGIDCRDVGIDAIPEWKYVYENEQCSVAYFNTMSNAMQHPDKEFNNVYRFSSFSKDEDNREYHTSGLLANMKYQTHDYGQLIVLDKARILNMGDVALMEVLVEKASLYLAASAKSSDNVLNVNVMNKLLEGAEVSSSDIEYTGSLIKGLNPDKNSRYGIFVFRFDPEERNTENIDFLQHILAKRFPSMYTWAYHDDLLAIVNTVKPHVLSQEAHAYLNSQGYQNKLHIGVSLSFYDLRKLPFFYRQSVFALEADGDVPLDFFYNYGHIFLLGNISLEEKLFAAEPMCRKIWSEQPEKRDFLKTLAVYLECERATGEASSRLYIHRNTLNYRVNYLKEYANWDFDDPELRDYIRLSLYYLSLTE